MPAKSLRSSTNYSQILRLEDTKDTYSENQMFFAVENSVLPQCAANRRKKQSLRTNSPVSRRKGSSLSLVWHQDSSQLAFCHSSDIRWLGEQFTEVSTVIRRITSCCWRNNEKVLGNRSARLLGSGFLFFCALFVRRLKANQGKNGRCAESDNGTENNKKALKSIIGRFIPEGPIQVGNAAKPNDLRCSGSHNAVNEI